MEEILLKFLEICKNRYDRVKNLKSQNRRKVCGYFCTYFPAELVHAAGMLPVRILGEKRKLVYVDKYLPSFSCSFVRGALEAGLSGTLDDMDVVAFSHTCDSIQVLSDVWGNLFKDKFVTGIMFPTRLDNPFSYKFLIEELKSFKCKLESYLGYQIKEKNLWESIRVYEKNRNLLKQVYEWRRQNHGLFHHTDILNIVISGMTIPVEEHNGLLEELISVLQEEEVAPRPINSGVKAVLAGNICVFPGIVEVIEGAGVSIVDDDLCTGRRSFMNYPQNETGEKEEDPIEYIARTCLCKLPCPGKHSDALKREEILLDIVEKSRADSVIFLVLRLCDPYSYNYIGLKKALDKKGYPNITFEYDYQTESFQQIQTRVEAFVESVSSKYQ